MSVFKEMEVYTNKMNSLNELSEKGKVMLIFLRHFGCNFCKRTLSDIHTQVNDLEQMGIKPVLVHMSSPRVAEEILKIYNLNQIETISDPNGLLYEAFGLSKGTFSQLFGFKVIFNTVKTWMQGYLSGKIMGDPYRMPGVFIYYKGKKIKSNLYRYISDRPDFIKIAVPQAL